MTDHAVQAAARALPRHGAMPWLVAAGVYALLVLLGARLLNDPDSYWHLAAGRWILAQGAVPQIDPFSFTFAGRPWIAKEWLSQVLYAGAQAWGGWTAVVALAAAAIALAFGLLTRFLRERLDLLPTFILVLAGFVLAAPHLLARPHALALPVMVTWTLMLVRAVDAKGPPPWVALPLMTLWANLHGGFTLGLALCAPLALEAVLTATPPARRNQAFRWSGFCLLALLAACITPYGPQSMMVTQRILDLGEALSVIVEWRPQDFSSLAAFEVCLLLAFGFALSGRLALPPLRILTLLGLLHLALAHTRNAEVLGLLAPLFLAAPLRAQFGAEPERASLRAPFGALIIAVLAVATGALASVRPLAPNANVTPAAAVAAMQRAGTEPVFNDYEFGGYLIHAGIAPFIDGRTELYGASFMMRYHRAVTLENLPDLLALLDEYKIGATLLSPTRPAVALLDRLPGWQRLHADSLAVVHVRRRI